MTANLEQFTRQLDRLLGLRPAPVTAAEPAIQTATVLLTLNLEAESTPPAELRARWTSRAQLLASTERKSFMQTLRARPLMAIVIVVLALLLLTGVAYAIGNALGYIYVPQANAFLPASTTSIIKQPVKQEYDGRYVIVTQGIATPSQVTLWLEFSETARPVDGAILKTLDGTEVALTYWEYSPNEPASRSVKMTFAPLPSGTMQTTLSLPEGWQIPLEWVPLSAAQKPESAISSAPYPATSMPIPENPCVESHDLQLCVLTATQSEGKTIVLVEAKSLGGQLAPGGDFMSELVWQDENSSVAIVDAQGNTFPMEMAQPATLSNAPEGRAAQLTFSGVPTDGQLIKLIIPGFYASVDVNQFVTVELGSDPQPGTIPVNSDVQVLGQTIRFRSGRLEGDGVTGLRLYLDSEPVTKLDGIEPYSLELGKPERIDDLFGSGNLAGSKDLFVELIQSSGKVTGQLVLPVVKATAVIHGPFEFNIIVSSTQLKSPTPIVANPGNFVPAPTATPISLNSYFYSGQVIESGDLLYTVLNDDKTQVYAFTPGAGQQSRLLVTLPGAASQIYLHPDRKGLDYLAGVQTNRDGIFYIKDISLYSIRFDESFPRFLHRFPPNPENTVGTTVEGDWSYDGRYAIFRYVKPLPGNDFWKFLWLDMSCRAKGDCGPHEILLKQDLELYKAYFAPANYRILFTGSDYSGTGETDLFVMNFDPKNTENQVINITAHSTSLSDDVGVSPALWMPDGRIFTLCNDGKMATMFCYVDPVTGKIDVGQAFTEHLLNYQLSPSGKYVLGIVINHNAPGKGILEIHKFDLNAQAGPVLASGRMFPFAVISASDQFIAYITENSDQVQLVDLVTGNTISVYSNAVSNVVTWLGWVR